MSAALGLGSNLGDRVAHLRAGLVVIRRRLAVLAVSSVYETTPQGGPPQPSYLNAVVLVDSADPWLLLAVAHEAESSQRRVRSVRNGPRSLDVDVLDVAGACHGDPELVLPHPRAHERAFVLVPWLEVDPGAQLAGYGPLGDLLAAVGPGGVTRRPELALQ